MQGRGAGSGEGARSQRWRNETAQLKPRTTQSKLGPTSLAETGQEGTGKMQGGRGSDGNLALLVPKPRKLGLKSQQARAHKIWIRGFHIYC